MTNTDYSLENLSDISPFENYTAAIRDKSTRKKYAVHPFYAKEKI